QRPSTTQNSSSDLWWMCSGGPAPGWFVLTNAETLPAVSAPAAFIATDPPGDGNRSPSPAGTTRKRGPSSINYPLSTGSEEHAARRPDRDHVPGRRQGAGRVVDPEHHH